MDRQAVVAREEGPAGRSRAGRPPAGDRAGRPPAAEGRSHLAPGDPRPYEPAEFREVLGRFLTGVTVVTLPDESGGVRGLTANAFMSVSLSPPLVVVSIARSANAHALLSGASHYGVSLLAEGQAKHALHFAGDPQDTAIEFVECGPIRVLKKALACLAARIVDVHPAGDHSLVIGQVEQLGVSARRTEPLGFYQSAFHRAEPVDGPPSADEALVWEQLLKGCWG